jgi:hypothetical protein
VLRSGCAQAAPGSSCGGPGGFGLLRRGLLRALADGISNLAAALRLASAIGGKGFAILRIAGLRGKRDFPDRGFGRIAMDPLRHLSLSNPPVLRSGRSDHAAPRSSATRRTHQLHPLVCAVRARRRAADCRQLSVESDRSAALPRSVAIYQQRKSPR